MNRAADECFPVPAAKGASAPSASAGAPSAATPPAASSRQVIADGHLDLGAKVEGGKLTAVLKDDRTQPAQWLDPASVVLHLTDASKAKAPGGLEFVAAQGNDIWLSASAQVPGVPWLGQNTMHESVVESTTGPVEWELIDVKGPGTFAVFTSGMFGGGVGERVFDMVGGPRKYTVRANTHAHPNWVFSEPGHYDVTIKQTATLKSGGAISDTTTLSFAVGVEPKALPLAPAKAAQPTGQAAPVVEGRTKAGQPCTLRPGLPGTGNSFVPEPLPAPDAEPGAVNDGGAAALVIVVAAALIAVGLRPRWRQV